MNAIATSSTAPSPSQETTPNDWDTGVPVPIGQARHYHADGSYEAHDGWAPSRHVPANDIDRLCFQRRYHQAKAQLASRAHRELWSWSRGNGPPITWDVKMHGPQPPESDEFRALSPEVRGFGFGRIAFAKPGLDRLEAIVKHHLAAVAEIEAQFRARGIDPEGRDV